MATCETSEETSSPAVGIVLVLLACCCYAFGNCLQRYSLLRQPGEKVFGVLNRHAGWLLGAIIYFSANFLYAVALSFAPVSVLAAVFSLTIIANATCAVLLLGDKIPLMAYPGYAMVLAGSIVFSVTLNAQVCHFDGSELVDVMTTPTAIIFWTILGLVMLGGCLFAWRFEKAYPIAQDDDGVASVVNSDQASAYVLHDDDAEKEKKEGVEEVQEQLQQQDSNVPTTSDETTDRAAPSSPLTSDDNEMKSIAFKDKQEDEEEIDPRSLLLARFIYPSSLGATEAMGALVLKAFNSLLTTIATEDEDPVGDDDYFNVASDQDYPEDIGLWISLIAVGVLLFLGIVLWLRLVYSRFEITGAFPVEFGMLTLASVVGGFAVFQDYKFVESWKDWLGVALAGIAILGGIGVVAYASWRAKVEEQQLQQEAKEPAASAGVETSNEEP